MKIYDFNGLSFSEKNGSYGGNSGSKIGILINNQNWLIKYPKKATKLRDVKNMSYTLSPVSEYIGSQIYDILGYPVHKTKLGIRDEHIVVACKDFTDKDHVLFEFRQLKNTYYKELNEKLDMSMTPSGSDHFSMLNEILIHLDYNPIFQKVPGIKERFWNCVVIDGLINNNDRNNGNWGILRSKEGDRLAPVFDNGSSFSPNVPEDKLMNKLNNLQMLVSSACHGITAYSLDGENNALFTDIIKLDVPELKSSIKKNVPLVHKNLSNIFDMIDEIPNKAGNYQILSNVRKEVYKKEIYARFENILLPEYNKIIEKEQTRQQNVIEKESDYGMDI